MNGVSILPASWRDIRHVAVLERACFQDDAWPLLDVILVLVSRDGVRLKAVAEDRVVGFVAAEQDRRDGVAWIATIGVLPEFQRRGIGRQLMRRCEAQLSVPRVRLTVRQGNRAARALYERLGYRPAGVWREYYRGGEDGIVMEKALEVGGQSPVASRQ